MTQDPRVLIVESDDVLRAMLFTILRHEPVEVDTARTAEEALRSVSQCDYALIIVDADMPDGEAVAFVTQFREQRPTATTFVLAVRDPRSSEYLSPDVVSAILNKPLEIDLVAELVRECAHVVPPPEDPLPCEPADSHIRSLMDRGRDVAN